MYLCVDGKCPTTTNEKETREEEKKTRTHTRSNFTMLVFNLDNSEINNSTSVFFQWNWPLLRNAFIIYCVLCAVWSPTICWTFVQLISNQSRIWFVVVIRSTIWSRTFNTVNDVFTICCGDFSSTWKYWWAHSGIFMGCFTFWHVNNGTQRHSTRNNGNILRKPTENESDV